MKKKLLVILLTLVCLVSTLALVSCGGGNTDDGRPSYTVTFDPAGGEYSGPTTVQVKEGDKIPQPANPSYDGKIFSGWYAGKTSSSKWNFDTDVVTADVTLKAWYAGGVSCTHEVTTPLPDKSTPATCTAGGKEYVKCNKCGLTTFTNLPKLGHDIVTEVIPVTCATDGYTHVYCQREGCTEDRTHTKIPATGNHEWGDKYESLVTPTMYIGGKEARVCQVCQAQKIFTIPSTAEMDGFLWDIDIGNYTYTGGNYVDASFVDIAKTAGIFATSYYTVCTIGKAIDNSTSTFWCADTLADGANFTGDTITLSFSQAFDIGMINLVVPYYYAWELGEDCYVSYDLEAMINGEWVKVGVLSDKDATRSGTSGSIVYEFESPINTDSIRLVVSNSSRYTPAMIYDISVMAAVPETERVSASLDSVSTYNSSGKYNSWATGVETLSDGSLATFWNSNYRQYANGEVDEVFATITFPEDKFVTAAQFVVAPNTTKEFSIYYMENGEWVFACKYKVTRGSSITLSGDYDDDKVVDGELVTSKDGTHVYFTCNLARFTSGVKLTIDRDDQWSSYVYEFGAYTAVEQAVILTPDTPNGIETYDGCKHDSYKTIETVVPTCTNAGYTVVECYGCGLTCKTDAVDSYGHLWGSYDILTAASGTAAGTKHSVCQKPDCDAERITAYYNDYEDAKVTTYKNNAPAAWAQTLDDGNYLGTYKWLIPKLQKYGWKATAMLSVCFSDMYVDEWNGYLATGVLDIGSHSYTHGGYYSGQISENSLLSDVHNAHYWFMANFAGQRILTFATPNGQTSLGTSEYATGIMAAVRNGGNSTYFYNIIQEFATDGYGNSPYVGSITIDEETGEVIFTQSVNKAGELVWVSTRRAWGNINSYISKADQTEGPYVYVKKDGTLASEKYKKITQKAVIDEETGEQAVDENGNLVWETLSTPIYEKTSGGYNKTENGSYNFDEKGGKYSLIKLPNSYVYVSNDDLTKNFVYDSESNRLKDIGITDGSYRYVEIRDESGKLLDNYFEWQETGSFDLVNGEFVFRNDNNGEYKLSHTDLGSYEKGINEILEVGGMTAECLHEIGQSGTIWSTYTSTNSKFTYLNQTGIWVCSYNELVQYIKEQVYSTVETISRTENEVVINVTDTLDDIMFNMALTIQVDVDDSWTQENITATQDGQDVEFFVENGYVYVNAVPDRGQVTISYNA